MQTGQPRGALPEGALAALVEGTAAETGERFFDELVKHLARALGTKGAWVTEWLERERRLRALSFWLSDAYYGDFEYDVTDTPCERVVEDRTLVHVPDRVIELYPRDPDLPPLGAVSYVGVPLFDTDGRILGHLAVLHDAPMPVRPEETAIIRIFAGRAAAELRRLRRDRDLREREQRLSRLIDSAMDAIFHLDEALVIVGANSAAEKIFACAASRLAGVAFDELLTADSRTALRRLLGDLAQLPEGRRSLWIPGGLEGIRAGGERFPAEATLSRFELDGRAYLTVILRDVNERQQAEERIRALATETASLRQELDALEGFGDIVGTSDALRRVLADVQRVAATDATVLVTGETGTGKELLARAIHQKSARAAKPMVKVNCAAISAHLQESEFFGHEKGAFTGAVQRRDGRFKIADGGTIFLDEVGEMPLDLQAKLLRVLQEGEFEPVGSPHTVKVDVRVIAATNRDLPRMVREGTFRQDLLYRLDVFPLHAPALRERGGDVVLLAEAFARRLARRRGGSVAPFDEADKAKLLRYDWPGNVRELQNVVERALITSTDGRRLNLDRALPETQSRAGEPTAAPPPDGRVMSAAEMQDFERRNILRALELARWKISGKGGAAEILGLHANTLASRMKALGITRA